MSTVLLKPEKTSVFANVTAYGIAKMLLLVLATGALFSFVVAVVSFAVMGSGGTEFFTSSYPQPRVLENILYVLGGAGLELAFRSMILLGLSCAALGFFNNFSTLVNTHLTRFEKIVSVFFGIFTPSFFMVITLILTHGRLF